MAGRFRQSCCWEPVTAGPPACFYFGSLVRKNQNDPFLLRSRGTLTASRAGSAQDWASAGLATGCGTRAGSPRGQLGAEEGIGSRTGDELPVWGDGAGTNPGADRFWVRRLHTHPLIAAFQFCSILLYCTVFTTPLNPLNWQVYFLFVLFLIVITFPLNNLFHSPCVFFLLSYIINRNTSAPKRERAAASFAVGTAHS